MFRCAKIGTCCLYPLILGSFVAIVASKIAYGQILPPGHPGTVAPPVLDQGDMYQDLENLRRNRKNRERRFKKNRPKGKTTQQKLDEIAKKPGPMRFFLTASPLLAYAYTTTEKATNYLVDPSMAVHAYWKPFGHKAFDNYELWTGFRMVPLIGRGVYENLAGRFGLTYFGPMVGVGRISPAIVSLSRAEQRKPSDQRKINFDRDGFFWMSGLALVNRTGEVESGRPAPKDFDRKGVTFDSPGLFTELTWFSIFYSKVSLHYGFGAQLGKDKAFFYFKFGAGFWY